MLLSITQVALLLVVAALLWLTRRRLSGWIARKKPAPTMSYQRRRDRGTIASKLRSFVSLVLPPWARWRRDKRIRGPKIAALAHQQKAKKPPCDARDDRGAAVRGGTSLATKNGRGTSAETVGSSATNSTTKTRCGNVSDDDDSTGGGDSGGDSSVSEGSSPRHRTGEPWSSRVSSWADAALFETGRAVGATVRAIVRPLAYARGGTVAASNAVQPESSPASPTSGVLQPPTTRSKGSKRAMKGSGNRAKGSSKTSSNASRQTEEAATARKPCEGLDDPVGKNKAPFAGGDVQRPAEGSETGKNNGSEEVVPAMGKPTATETEAAGGSGQREHGTWTSVLASLAKDPSNRYYCRPNLLGVRVFNRQRLHTPSIDDASLFYR